MKTSLSLSRTRLTISELVRERRRLLGPLWWGAQVIRKARRERGQALIEFAFVLPIMLVFLLVMTDFGMAVGHRLLVQHALTEGLREAQVTDQLVDITDTTASQSGGLLDAGDVTVCYVDENGNGDPGEIGDKVRVAVNYTYKLTVAGGEMMSAFGATPPSISMNPDGVAALQVKVDGATSCP